MNEENILAIIAKHKEQEVLAAKKNLPLEILIEKIKLLEPSRDFIASLNKKLNQNKPAVIAEIKKASPSKGVIRDNFDPLAIAIIYENSGAACLSVLTDEKFFQGKAEYIRLSKTKCHLPILRKDFLIDEYQIYESKYLGADCILLIAALLSVDLLMHFYEIATRLNLAVLIEVHNEEELDAALKVPSQLVGINNRDLKTFRTDLQITTRLKKNIPKDRIIVTESGIHTREDVLYMQKQGVNCFLVGESLMKEVDITKKYKELFNDDLSHDGRGDIK